MADETREVKLTLPAEEEYLLIARMTMGGFGMLAGLECGLIDDLRTAVNESCDCLLHQPARLAALELSACVRDGRLHCEISAKRACACGDGCQCGDRCACAEPQDLEVTRCVLETVMPDVTLFSDGKGVHKVAFSLPV